MGAGTHPGEIIVLAQRRKIGGYIYEELIRRGLPAKSYYQDTELEDEVTQERFALLKLAADQDDRVALRWLIGKKSSSWYSGGYTRIRARCEETGLAPWFILQALADGEISIPHTTPLVASFRETKENVEALQAMFEQKGISALINQLFPDGDDRWRDIRSLERQIAFVDVEGDEYEGGLSDFVAELNYAIAQPEIPSEIQDVRIMSLHKSKGLSASATIVASCVEGVIPTRLRTC